MEYGSFRSVPARGNVGVLRLDSQQVASNTPGRIRTRTASRRSSTLKTAGQLLRHSLDPRECAENHLAHIPRLSMNCAKCHNHPMEKWTNND